MYSAFLCGRYEPLALKGFADPVPIIPTRFWRDDKAECPDPGPDQFAVLRFAPCVQGLGPGLCLERSPILLT